MKFLILFLFTLNAFAECEPKSVSILDGDFKVDILKYESPSTDRHIIIIPPTGGTNYLDKNWGENFCEEGFTAHILEHWTNDNEFALDLGIHQRFYSRTQKAIGILLSSLPEKSFIGIMGTSIGGIHTAMAMGLNDRPDAAFVITAGADMPSMIANSDQEAMVNAWNKRKELLKIPDKETYISLLREKIEYEPTKLPKKFEGKDLGMIIATSDTTVPTANQLVLKNHWQPKTVIDYSFNHFWAIVLSWAWDSGTVIDFFKQSSDKKVRR